MLASLPLIVFPFCLIASALTDIYKFVIPNTLSMALIAGFAVAFAVSGLGWDVLGTHLLVGFCVLFICIGLFAAKLLGGGDGKLLAGVALWLGWPAFVTGILYIAVAGGALAISLAALWGFARFVPRASILIPPLANLAAKPLIGLPLPYGIAIAIGAIAAFPKSPIFVALAGSF